MSKRSLINLVVILCFLNLKAQNYLYNYLTTYTYTDSTGRSDKAIITRVYYDGLGRERLNVRGNNALGFIAQRTDYDQAGRQSRKWVPSGGYNDVFISVDTIEKRLSSFYGVDELPYTHYEYELSGRQRIAGEYQPGKQWNNYGITTTWHRNDSVGIYSCLLLRVNKSSKSIIVTGQYSVGALSITETTDEDGLRSLIFINNDDKVVLKRCIGGDIVADTRYIYDCRGNLCCTISPEGCRLLPSCGVVDDYIIEQYATQFEYDYLHRCISKKLPGCEPVQYVYNKIGLPILWSDAEDRQKSVWTLTKYDNKHRPIVRGSVKFVGATRDQLQLLYGDSLMVETYIPTYNIMESQMMYTINSGPKNFEPYQAWFYDDYNFILGPNASIKKDFDTDGEGFTAMGLCTGTAMKDTQGITWYTANKYNSRGNIVRSCSWDCFLQNRIYDTSTSYDFTEHPIAKTETLCTVMEAEIIDRKTAQWSFIYDTMGRLISQLLSVNGCNPIEIQHCSYDDIGRLNSERRGVTMIAYDYDIRSRLIKTTSNVYTEHINYCRLDDYGSCKWINGITECWMGNKNYIQQTQYRYDNLGRLCSSICLEHRIGEKFEIDLNANVVAVQRLYKGSKVQDAVITMNGNKVSTVRDVSHPYYMDVVPQFSAGDFNVSYDANGRLVNDETRQISSIQYCAWSDLPMLIKMNNGDFIRSNYLPNGTLIDRTFNTVRLQAYERVNIKGDTIRGVRRNDLRLNCTYNGSFENRNGFRVNTTTGYYDIAKGQYYWYVTNRQKSVTAIIDDVGHVIQRIGYYASGTPYILPADYSGYGTMQLDSVSNRLHIGNQWLGHSGIDFYDNTARFHDPLLCRFITTDPKALNYPSLSPWSHCSANPANIIDPKGMDTYLLNKEGTFSLICKSELPFDIIVTDEGKSIDVPKSFFGESEIGVVRNYKYNETIPYVTYKMDGNGMNVFEFCANNSDVEWSRMEFSDGYSIIGTSNSEWAEGASAGYMRNHSEERGKLLSFDHTHPIRDNGPSGPDVELVRYMEKYAPQAKFRVFFQKDFKIKYHYTGNTPFYDSEQIQELPTFEFEFNRSK